MHTTHAQFQTLGYGNVINCHILNVKSEPIATKWQLPLKAK